MADKSLSEQLGIFASEMMEEIEAAFKEADEDSSLKADTIGLFAISESGHLLFTMRVIDDEGEQIKMDKEQSLCVVTRLLHEMVHAPESTYEQ